LSALILLPDFSLELFILDPSAALRAPGRGGTFKLALAGAFWLSGALGAFGGMFLGFSFPSLLLDRLAPKLGESPALANAYKCMASAKHKQTEFFPFSEPVLPFDHSAFATAFPFTCSQLPCVSQGSL
jgi:hypothetical protein